MDLYFVRVRGCCSIITMICGTIWGDTLSVIAVTNAVGVDVAVSFGIRCRSAVGLQCAVGVLRHIFQLSVKRKIFTVNIFRLPQCNKTCTH